MAPGSDWQDELAAALCASSACAVCIGPHGFGDWERLELKVATDRMAKDRRFRLFLVLLPGLPEPFEFGSLPPFLCLRSWVDLRGGIEDSRSFQVLVSAVKGIPLGPESPVQPRDDACPYRGLQMFEEEHAEFFFGRTGDVQRLLEKLKGTRFLAVVGPSGSGKSSLVRAGVIPALRRGGLPDSDQWTIRAFTPGAHPLAALAGNLLRLYPQDSMQATLDQMSVDTRTLHLAAELALAERPATERVLWVIDGFEEIFTLCRDDNERRQFLANLLYATLVPGGRNGLILTLRADFYAKCAAYPELSGRIAERQFLVTRMDEEGLREVIEQPASRVGLEFEPGLVDTILSDIAGQPGSLPLLEHALLELWERRTGRLLTLGGYRDTGGIEGAVAKRAESVYSALDRMEQGISRRILLRLTQPGEGTEDTRRRAAISELITDPAETGPVEAVLRALAQARLLTTGGEEPEGEAWADVSHEALIRGWPRLRAWIEEDRAGLRVHRRLTEAAQEWQRLNRDEGALYRGTGLGTALEWSERNEVALNELERQFLDASLSVQTRERRAAQRRIRMTLAGMSSALLLISIAAFIAFQERNEALSHELAANATSQLPIDPELSVLLAAEAVRVRRTPQADEVLRRSLSSFLETRVFTVMRGHSEGLTDAILSPDGKLVATASIDGTACLWEAASGRNISQLRGHKGAVLSLAFDSFGKLLATAGADKTARVWEAASGNLVAELRGHSDAVLHASFSPDGKRIVTASADKTARVWEARTGKAITELSGHKDAVSSAVFDQQGESVTTASRDKTLRFWFKGQSIELGPTNGAMLGVVLSPDGNLALTAGLDGAYLWAPRGAFWLPHAGDLKVNLSREGLLGSFIKSRFVYSAQFSPDGKTVVTAGADYTARIWEVPRLAEIEGLKKGRELRVLRGHTDEVSNALFSSDGTRVVTASVDHTARVWDANTGDSLFELRGHTGPLHSAVFSPDGKWVLTASLDRTARIWDVGALFNVTELPDAGGLRGRFGRDGKWLAVGGNSNNILILDASTGRRVTELKGPTERVNHVEFAPDGRRIMAASADGAVRVWDAGTGHNLAELHGHAGEVISGEFSPDGKQLITGGADSTARIWDAATGRNLAELRGHTGPVRIARFSPDGQWGLTASDDGTARLWELRTGRAFGELRGHSGIVLSAAFSQDGRRVVTSGDSTARLWDARSGRVLAVLQGHTGQVGPAVFSPDGKLVVTPGTDHTARLWDGNTGRSIAVLQGHSDTVTSATFSPDGRFVGTSSFDRTVRLWNASTGKPLARASFDKPVFTLVFSPDGRTLLVNSGDLAGIERVFLYTCQVCGDLRTVLAVARARVSRQFTPEERKQYLHDDR